MRHNEFLNVIVVGKDQKGIVLAYYMPGTTLDVVVLTERERAFEIKYLNRIVLCFNRVCLQLAYVEPELLHTVMMLECVFVCLCLVKVY